MLTPETLEALARNRAAVDRLVDAATDDVLTAWLLALRESEEELRRVIAADDWETADRARRLERSRQIIAERITEAAQASVDRLTPEAQRLVDIAGAQQEALIATQLPPGAVVGFGRAEAAELAAIVRRTTEQITVRHWYLSAEATQAVQAALRLGIAGGQNPREAAERMIERVQGAFNGGIARAHVIARTEMLDAHRDSTLQSRIANQHLLSGWMWYATLSSDRTCLSCIAQHGSLHPADEPGPLDHHQGRCTAMPVTRSWRELGFNIDEPDALAVQPGPEWFAGLPAERQAAIMGPARYEAYTDGRFPPEAWSVRRTSEGWRDAYHEGKPAPA